MIDQETSDNAPVAALIPTGSCIVSNKIMLDGMHVGYMYREEPDDSGDSGWRFLSGTERQQYVDDDSNHQVLAINSVIAADPAIGPYLDRPFGTELERVEGKNIFQVI